MTDQTILALEVFLVALWVIFGCFSVVDFIQEKANGRKVPFLLGVWAFATGLPKGVFLICWWLIDRPLLHWREKE